MHVAESQRENGILDLCSGAGGPLPHIQKDLADQGLHIPITLTDLVPNVESYKRIVADAAAEHGDRKISYISQSVDATLCKHKGFRTIFGSFHHFEPDLAKRIVEDAVRTNSGIAIFDPVSRTMFNLFFFFPIFMPWVTGVPAALFVKPFSVLRILLTWIGLIPAINMWDGFVSCLRAYKPKEFMDIVKTIHGWENYTWNVGVKRVLLGPNLTYYIGFPKNAASADASGAAASSRPNTNTRPNANTRQY